MQKAKLVCKRCVDDVVFVLLVILLLLLILLFCFILLCCTVLVFEGVCLFLYLRAVLCVVCLVFTGSSVEEMFQNNITNTCSLVLKYYYIYIDSP